MIFIPYRIEQIEHICPAELVQIYISNYWISEGCIIKQVFKWMQPNQNCLSHTALPHQWTAQWEQMLWTTVFGHCRLTAHFVMMYMQDSGCWSTIEIDFQKAPIKAYFLKWLRIHFRYEWDRVTACEDAYYHLFSLPLHSTQKEKQFWFWT
jgi:hypothetical protein